MYAVGMTEHQPRVEHLGGRVKVDPFTCSRILAIGFETAWIIQCELLVPVVAGDRPLCDVLNFWYIEADTAAA